MTSPLTSQQLDEINSRIADYRKSHDHPGSFACCTAHAVADQASALLAEVRRLTDELAEEAAHRNPRLRCLIVKAAPDKHCYIGWSNSADGPTGVWSRETAIEYGFPASRLNRADTNGSSATNGFTSGHWDDSGFIADQRGWLRRDRLADYAIEYLHGDRVAAYALLEPFEDDTATAAVPPSV